jgi:hypothetical protein
MSISVKKKTKNREEEKKIATEQFPTNTLEK